MSQTPTQTAKIFCIGFHKTGTTSLYSALTSLGYRTSGTVGFDLGYEELKKKGADLCIEAARDIDAAEDMPWPLYFRELDAAFPGSKFILTLRDLDNWYASVAGHFEDRTPPMHALTYGPDKANALDHEDHWIATHQAHLEAVRAWFADRPGDLLEMDLAAGDGWEKLCAFLGKEIPETPFPQKNTSKIRHSWRYRLLRKLHALTGRQFYPEQAA